MKTTECSSCGNQSVPINTSMKIDGKIFCTKCLELNFPTEESVTGKKVEKLKDPTVCDFCNKDNQGIDLPAISNLPICEECETKIRNRTFPNWVKGFFATIILIVIFSFFFFCKYYQAYKDLTAANTSFQKGDYSDANTLMKKVADNVPEVEEFNTLSSFFSGIDLLTKDKSTQALAELNKCKDKLPEDYNINYLITKAKCNSCFDNRDYNGFLKESKKCLYMDTSIALSWAAVASAYACIYATEGHYSSEVLARNALLKAKSIDNTSKDMKDYYNKIEYRIYSREILTSADFNKKYPRGWVVN